MRHVLVVANRTLGGDDLMAAVRERIAAGPVEFYLVVPITGGSGRAPVMGAPGGASAVPLGEAPHDPEGATPYELAERRLQHGVNRIRQAGGTVDGEVGEHDPQRAVESVLARRDVDEVIVSTLPTGASHWLRADLPARVHRKHHLPVTTVTMRVASMH